MTKNQILAILAELADDVEVAVPGIWVKEDVEEMYAYGDPAREIDLTPEQWSQVVAVAEASESISDEEMVCIVQEVLES